MHHNLLLAKQILKQFMSAYLIEKNSEKTLSFITEDFYSMGTGFFYIAKNKKEFQTLLQNQIEKIPPFLSIVYHFIDIKIISDCTALLFCKFSIYKNKILSMKIQQNAVLCLEKESYKISSLHNSSSFVIKKEKQHPLIYSHKKSTAEINEEIGDKLYAFLNSSVPGGMLGGYIEEGFPLYFINHHLLVYLGYTYDEFIKETKGFVLNCIHPDDRNYVNEIMTQSLQNSDEYKAEYRILKKDGSFIWVLSKGKKISVPDNRSILVNVCIDITESIHLQKQLKEKATMLTLKNKELEEITNNVPSGVIKCDVSGKYQFSYLSDGFIKLVGYNRQEIKEQFHNNFYEMIFPQDIKKTYMQIKEQSKNSGIIQIEYRIPTKTGDLLWILTKGEFIKDQDQTYFYGILIDITQTKRQEDAIQALTDSIPGGVCEIAMDDSFTLLYGNETFYTIYGYTPVEMEKELNNELIYTIHEKDRTEMKKTIQTAYETKKKWFELEKRIIKRDGSIAWFLTRGTFAQKKEKTVLNCVLIDITDRKKFEKELKISEERFRIALSKTSNIVFDYDILSRTIIHSERFTKLYGLPSKFENAPQSLVEKEIIHKDYIEPLLTMYQKIHEGDSCASCIVQTKIFDGSYVWNRITLTTIYDENNLPVRAIGMAENITRQKETELAYKKEEQYRAAMLSDAIIYYEMNITQNKIEKNGRIWVSHFKEFFTDNYTKKLFNIIEKILYEEDKELYYNTFSREKVLEAFSKGQAEIKLEHRRLNSSGHLTWMLTTMHLVKDIVSEDVKGFVYVKDINQQKQDSLLLEYQSQRDPLTGLYNKGTTEKLIKKVLKEHEDFSTHAFIILDVDHFKEINDTYGHMFGDKVLAEISKRMKHLFRSDDIIGRIGGDEFVILIKNIRFIDFIDERAKKICSLFHSIILQNQIVNISCSIGISVYDIHGITFEELYQKADVALYEAKNKGRNQYIYYNYTMKNPIEIKRTIIDSEKKK